MPTPPIPETQYVTQRAASPLKKETMPRRMPLHKRGRNAAVAITAALAISGCIDVPIGYQQAAMLAQPGPGLAPKAIVVVPTDLRGAKTAFRPGGNCAGYWFMSKSGDAIINSVRATLMGAYPEVVVDDGVSDIDSAGPADRYVLSDIAFTPELHVGSQFVGTAHVTINIAVTPQGQRLPTVHETLSGFGSDHEYGACHAAALAVSRASQHALHDAMVVLAKNIVNPQAESEIIRSGLR